MPGTTGFGFVGIGKETTKGTGVAPTHYIPATSMDGEDSVDVLRDEGLRASMATIYGAVKGVTSASYSLEGNVHVDTLGFLLAGIMGGTNTTGAGPFTHTFSLLNSGTGQCRSYSFTDYQGLQTRRYAAATESSLSLRVSAQELFTYSSQWTTFGSTTQSTPAPSFSTLDPIAGWTGAVNLGGGANTLLEEMDVTFTRNVTPVHTVDGTSDPLQIWQGPLSVSGRMMLIADAETEFTRYLGVTFPAMTVTLTQGTASLALTMSKLVYTSAKIERGDDFTQASVQFEAIANTTDAGASGGLAPAKLVLINSVASGTYD